jgi:predicted ester cyclase/catechol 2,3-dioxygenase-like lactoylglutathione lyase family enzyme
MMQSEKLKGIDNVFFSVLDIKEAVRFYEQIGFKKKLEIPRIKSILFSIGDEEPGLILSEKQALSPGRIWIEVDNASKMRDYCSFLGIKGQELETNTGLTFEITDPWDNVLGFADYSKKTEMARKKSVKEIAESYARRIWEQKDLSAIDEMLHPEVVIHSLLGSFYGRPAMKTVVQSWLTGFPDLTVKNISTISEGDLAVLHWQAHGTHAGEFKGVKASRRQVLYVGTTIYRVQNGLITEYWAYLDLEQLLKQIR